MATDTLFGWNLTFKTIEKDVKKKSDVLVAFIHWNLMKRGFRNIGIGDERTLTGDEEKTELLPAGWNDGPNYSMRYILDDKLYILHALTTDGNLLINLMRSDDLAVSNIALNIDETVKELSGTIERMMPSYNDLMHHVKRNLIDTICNKPTTSTETQTAEPSGHRRSLDDPLRVPSRPRLNRPEQGWEGFVSPQIGRADLDPFYPGGGGMIYDPFAPNPRGPENPGLGVPGGLPRGAVPPGARFDPFAPPGVPPPPNNRRPPPDSDHFPPPSFDDMFM